MFMYFYGISMFILALYVTNSEESFIPSSGWEVNITEELTDN